MEDLELILAADGRWTPRKPLGSMGDDTPMAVLSEGSYRGLHHFFRQAVQPGHQPADRFRFGNIG